jgi:hypothetical protein
MKRRLLIIVFLWVSFIITLSAEDHQIKNQYVMKYMHRLAINGLFDACLRKLNEDKLLIEPAEAYGILYQTEFSANYMILIDYTKEEKNIWIIYPEGEELKFIRRTEINQIAAILKKASIVVAEHADANGKSLFDDVAGITKTNIEIRLFHYKAGRMRSTNHSGTSEQPLPIVFGALVQALKNPPKEK